MSKTVRNIQTGARCIYRGTKTRKAGKFYVLSPVNKTEPEDQFEVSEVNWTELYVLEANLTAKEIDDLDLRRADFLREQERKREAWEARRAEERLADEMLADLEDEAWWQAKTVVQERGAAYRNLVVAGLPHPSRGKAKTYYTPTIEVTLCVNDSAFRGTRTVEVNWSALGAQSPRLAARYAQLILDATAMADDFLAGYDERKAEEERQIREAQEVQIS